MKRLAVEQEVALSVGDVTVDCRVAALSGGEAALAPLEPADSGLLPAASAGASLVFTHGGRLVMLRGAMYRATGDDDLRFAEKSGGAGPSWPSIAARPRACRSRCPPRSVSSTRTARRSARSASSSRATSASAASPSGPASAGSPPARTCSSRSC